MLRRLLARLQKRAETVIEAPFEFGADGRLKETWRREEWKVSQRAFDAMRMRGIEVFLRCDAPSCRGYVMTHHKTKDGAIIVRCPHKDRLFSRL